MSHINVPEKVRAGAELRDTIFMDLAFPIEWRYCECCTVWYWPTFSMSQIWNVNVSETVMASEKCVQWLFWKQIVFSVEWHHRQYCSLWSLRQFSRSRIWTVNIWQTVRAVAKNASHDFHKSQYSPLNGTIVNFTLCNIVLHFLGQLLLLLWIFYIKYTDVNVPSRFALTHTASVVEFLLLLLLKIVIFSSRTA